MPGSQRGQHVTGKRAVAAVTEVAQLVAEALRTVVGVPSLCDVRVPGFLQGGASLPAVVCVSVISFGCHSLAQELHGRQVQLTSCADGEQVLPMAQALLSLLRAQVRHAAWPRWHTSRHGTRARWHMSRHGRARVHMWKFLQRHLRRCLLLYNTASRALLACSCSCGPQLLSLSTAFAERVTQRCCLEGIYSNACSEYNPSVVCIGIKTPRSGPRVRRPCRSGARGGAGHRSRPAGRPQRLACGPPGGTKASAPISISQTTVGGAEGNT